jgi:endonuclease/exonuclease/phosphatase family metal-dependent hydrolase
MEKIKIATFNVENLFFRYRFNKNIDSVGEDGFTVNDLAFSINDYDAKKITAEVIKEVDADIICFQEVENMGILEKFNSEYLAKMKYNHRILIDSHDTRFIDVAILSRYPATSIKTHKDERNLANTAWLFSRDCLKVTFDIEGKDFTVYVNHFKSMMEGRDVTKTRRIEQVKRVAQIIDLDWKKKNYVGNFAVCGDFNDYIDPKTSLNDLVKHPALVNVIDRLPKKDQWTHYYAGGAEVHQLDYILIPKALADKNKNKLPQINRKGLPFRADKFYNGPRYDSVGENYPKASDHCPFAIELTLL